MVEQVADRFVELALCALQGRELIAHRTRATLAARRVRDRVGHRGFDARVVAGREHDLACRMRNVMPGIIAPARPGKCIAIAVDAAAGEFGRQSRPVKASQG
jgi:hypothetical protein